EKNIKRNVITNCFLMNYGLSNENREAFLYYFKSGSAIASIENLIDHPNARKEKCLFKTLDTVFSDLALERLDLVKCDVEGSELFVLQGAKETIKKCHPIFLIEICEEWCTKCNYRSEDIIHFLINLGYDLFSTSDGSILERRKKIRRVDQGKYNYFFFHKEKHLDLITQLCPSDRK
ncbi:MAG: FkbM family methyltransferase, partial [Chlamydiia bacterium]|nr:FkbM family methyltransferase [Chlamydiia bacterium]